MVGPGRRGPARVARVGQGRVRCGEGPAARLGPAVMGRRGAGRCGEQVARGQADGGEDRRRFASGMTPNSAAPSRPSAMLRLARRSSWAGQRADQPVPVFFAPGSFPSSTWTGVTVRPLSRPPAAVARSAAGPRGRGPPCVGRRRRGRTGRGRCASTPRGCGEMPRALAASRGRRARGRMLRRRHGCAPGRRPQSAACIPVGAAFGMKMSNSRVGAWKCLKNQGWAGSGKPRKCSASEAE